METDRENWGQLCPVHYVIITRSSGFLHQPYFSTNRAGGGGLISQSVGMSLVIIRDMQKRTEAVCGKYAHQIGARVGGGADGQPRTRLFGSYDSSQNLRHVRFFLPTGTRNRFFTIRSKFNSPIILKRQLTEVDYLFF